MTLRRVRIIGAGLIGTSIALRLKERGWGVEIRDVDSVNEAIASDLLGQGSDGVKPELVIIATPPSAVLTTLKSEYQRNPEATFIDVSSIKTKVQQEVESVSDLADRFVGTHPISGREFGGPQSARSDLFDGRAWVIAPGERVNSEKINYVEDLVADLGAIPYRMTPEEHDYLFARISHLPQLLSIALANSLEQVGSSIDLAGQGLRDMLRIAGSSGDLWSEILLDNSTEILNSIDQMRLKLDEIESALKERDELRISNIFKSANIVHAKLSGKHGLRPRPYSFLNVVIEDKPGQLGALFNECAEISANVEDLALEHSPRQETGLIRLALSGEDAERLRLHLANKGWRVHLQ